MRAGPQRNLSEICRAGGRRQACALRSARDPAAPVLAWGARGPPAPPPSVSESWVQAGVWLHGKGPGSYGSPVSSRLEVQVAVCPGRLILSSRVLVCLQLTLLKSNFSSPLVAPSGHRGDSLPQTSPKGPAAMRTPTCLPLPDVLLLRRSPVGCRHWY